MKYLVTGGFGFIGSHLVERLYQMGHEITVVDDLSNGSLDNVPIEIRKTIKISIEPIEEFYFEEHYDGIFHLATHSRGYSIVDPYTNIRTNMLGMASVLEEAKDSGAKVVFASNSGIADPETLPITEDSEDAPTTPYDVTKLASEHLMKVYHDLHGVKGIILRFGTVYGERQKVSDELKWYPVIATFVRDALEEGIVWITGNGTQTRDFVYVGDIIDALIIAMNSDIDGADKFLISNGVEHTLNEVHSMIEKILGRDIPVLVREPLKGDIPRNWLDTEKANCVLGWHPTVPLKKGLERLIGH